MTMRGSPWRSRSGRDCGGIAGLLAVIALSGCRWAGSADSQGEPTAALSAGQSGDITFYQSFDNGGAPDIAAPGTVYSSYVPIKTNGLFGSAQDPVTDSDFHYAAEAHTDPGNIALSRSGSVSTWFKHTTPPTPTGLFLAYDSESSLELIVQVNLDNVKAILISNDGPSHYVGEVSTPLTPDNGWHLVVVNWTRSSFAISIDGLPSERVSRSPTAYPPSVPVPGTVLYTRYGVPGCVTDELMILNRTLGDDEIQWYHDQAAAPVVPNPALARFGPDDPGRRIVTSVTSLAVVPPSLSTIRVRVDLSELLTLSGLTSVGLQVVRASDDTVVGEATMTAWPNKLAEMDWSLPSLGDDVFPPKSYKLNVTLNGTGPFTNASISSSRFVYDPRDGGPNGGTCSGSADGTACDDGIPCTMGESCQGGACTLGPDSLCTAGSNATFYVSCENGSTADIAGGPKAALGSFVSGPGLFGLGLAPGTDRYLAYSDTGPTPDVALTKPGSISFWIKIASSYSLDYGLVQVQDGHSGNSLYIVEDASGIGVDIYQTQPGQPLVFPFRSGGHSATWAGDGRWHLIVVNWSRTSVGVSLDGVPPVVTSTVPWFAPGHIFYGPAQGKILYFGGGGAGFVKDELLILNRPMTTAEISWYYAQAALGGPTAVNPAIARFSAPGAACDPNDDLNPCTTDACNTTSGTTHAAVSANVSCDNGNVCDGAEMCNGSGTCVAGAQTSVDDGNPCTADSCTYASGLTHVPVPVDDQDPCTVDACSATGQVTHTPVVCTATDQCHVGVCNRQTGACQDQVRPDETPCSDGNACTRADICIQGACVAGMPVSCTVHDACHLDGVCAPATGICSSPVNPSPSCAGAPAPTVTSLSPTTPGATPRELPSYDPSTGTLTITGIPDSPSTIVAPATTVVVPGLQGATMACVADITGDGTPDLVFANASARSLKYVPRVDIQTALYDPSQVTLIDGATPQGQSGPAACGDIDGDGRPDIVMSFATPSGQGTVPTLVAYLNTTGGFQRITLASGLEISGIVVGGMSLADFNGDGLLDLALYAANNQPLVDSQIYVFKNLGASSGYFAGGARTGLPYTGLLATQGAPNWGALTTRDWDGDGLADIWALGNRGALFLYRSLGAFQFAEPVFDGAIDNLPARFSIGSMDADADGIPDLVVSNLDWAGQVGSLGAGPDGEELLAGGLVPPLDPGKIVKGTGGGTVTNNAVPAPPRPTAIPVGSAPPPFKPVIHTASDPIGLVKGSPLATTYVDDRGFDQPSILMQAVNGHLVERLRYATKTMKFIAPAATQQLLPSISGSQCLTTVCDSASGALTPLVQQGEDVTNYWVWVDHGTPPGTIVDSKPSVVMRSSASTTAREIFVRGLDGHLWELYQYDGQETWLDRDVPSARFSPNGTPPFVSNPGAKMVRAPSATISVSSPGALETKVFVVDSQGHMDSFQTDRPEHPVWSMPNPWMDTGLIGEGNCFGGVGHVGDGGPKAITWTDNSFVKHVEAFVVSSEGDLFHWRKDAGLAEGWMETINSYFLAPLRSPGSLPGLPHAVPVCPSAVDDPFRAHVIRPLAFAGTPEVVALNVGGTPVRQVFLRSTTGALWRYRSVGLPSATTDGRLATLASTTRSILPGASPPVEPIAIIPPETQDSPFCDASEKSPTFGTDFVAVAGLIGGFINLLSTDDQHNIVAAHVDVASSLNASSPWEWEAMPIDRDSPNNASPEIVATPGGVASAETDNALYIYATRADGVLDEASDKKGINGWHNCGGQIDDTHYDKDINPYALCIGKPHDFGICALGLGSTFAWTGGAGPIVATNHEPPGVPRVVNNDDAVTGGQRCKTEGEVVSLLPQWARVKDLNPVGGSSGVSSELLYPGADTFGGYEAEVMEEVEGTVVASHISSKDNPLNHTIGAWGEWPQIHHDWNVVVAPDPKYQHLMSNANILAEGGTMEMEWEVGDHLLDGQRVVGTKGFTTDAVPAVGDRVAVRGRYMFDCGHPPFHTEIHPINAMAVVHGKSVKLRFSTAGGRAWYQPNDTNLVTNLNGKACTLDDSVKALYGQFTEAGWAAGILNALDVYCSQANDLSQFSSLGKCYGEYDPHMVPIVQQWPSTPLSFDIPAPGAIASFSPQTVAFTQSPSTVNPGSTTIVMTTTDIAAAMPEPASSPSTGDHQYTPHFDALVSSLSTGFTQVGYAPRMLTVCFTRTDLIGHDNRPAHCTGYSDDPNDEKLTYVTANGQAKLYAPGGDNCLTVGVEAGEGLHIGAHGFECDFSCGERWDEESIGESNDRVGTIDLVVPIQSLALPNQFPKTITALSQASNDTTRSRLITGGDYKMTITIADQ